MEKVSGAKFQTKFGICSELKEVSYDALSGRAFTGNTERFYPPTERLSGFSENVKTHAVRNHQTRRLTGIEGRSECH